MWPLRIAAARLRPLNGHMLVKMVVVAGVVALFLWGDYVLFRRLFRAIAEVEAATPFFALGLLRNLLALVFLVATVVLFSSALTTAIGSFFTDLDLEFYHRAPRTRLRVAVARYLKTFLHSAAVVIAFLIPLVVAFEHVFPQRPGFHAVVVLNIVLLLSIPVSLAATVIVVMVRAFPVQRVHQIVATLAVLVLTAAVVAFRVSRPERLFQSVGTDDVLTVLRAIELPALDFYPGTALAELMTGRLAGPLPARIGGGAATAFLLFLVVAAPLYFRAYVRARESMAPVAFGSGSLTRWLDKLLVRVSPPVRAMAAKEIRTLTRDVAQWSQVFLMLALLFMYLYNLRMLPLGGDARATFIAYANLGMAGFVVAAICLRFAYPSVSAEGKAFWLMQAAPVAYRQLLVVKVLVYGTPLVALALLLTAFANILLAASLTVWTFTTVGAALVALTLVCLGVGMGALDPEFNAENPLQVGLSLGGFAYMAVALLYVGTMMIIMARPIVRYFFWRVMGVADTYSWVSAAAAVVAALVLSGTLAIVPLAAGERRLTRLSQSG